MANGVTLLGKKESWSFDPDHSSFGSHMHRQVSLATLPHPADTGTSVCAEQQEGALPSAASQQQPATVDSLGRHRSEQLPRSQQSQIPAESTGASAKSTT